MAAPGFDPSAGSKIRRASRVRYHYATKINLEDLLSNTDIDTSLHSVTWVWTLENLKNNRNPSFFCDL